MLYIDQFLHNKICSKKFPTKCKIRLHVKIIWKKNHNIWKERQHLTLVVIIILYIRLCSSSRPCKNKTFPHKLYENSGQKSCDPFKNQKLRTKTNWRSVNYNFNSEAPTESFSAKGFSVLKNTFAKNLLGSKFLWSYI